MESRPENEREIPELVSGQGSKSSLCRFVFGSWFARSRNGSEKQGSPKFPRGEWLSLAAYLLESSWTFPSWGTRFPKFWNSLHGTSSERNTWNLWAATLKTRVKAVFTTFWNFHGAETMNKATDAIVQNSRSRVWLWVSSPQFIHEAAN